MNRVSESELNRLFCIVLGDRDEIRVMHGILSWSRECFRDRNIGCLDKFSSLLIVVVHSRKKVRDKKERCIACVYSGSIERVLVVCTLWERARLAVSRLI